jgi:hypothetical protein
VSGLFWINANGVGWGLYGAVYLIDQEMDDRWKARFNYTYQYRAIGNNREQYGFWAAWPRPRGLSGDATVPLYMLGQDSSDGGLFENVSVPDSGSQRGYFIVGTVKDGSGNPVAAAILDVFITATDQWVCTTQTDSNGIYSAPTPFTGVQHYIVVNYGPNSLVGASVNTLVPGTSPW